MLEILDSKEPFRVMSFDPGSSNLGFAIIDWDFEASNKPILKEAFTYKLNAKHESYRSRTEQHGDRVVRMMILRDSVLEALREYTPNALVIESNYMGRFANGFAALVECVAMIRSALFDYDPFMTLYMVDPTTVKTNVGMKRIKGTTKDDVKIALVKSDKIQWNGFKADDLDEHTIDAIAIGCWYLDKVI